jgi:molybdate transport system substrate-binding protein
MQARQKQMVFPRKGLGCIRVQRSEYVEFREPLRLSIMEDAVKHFISWIAVIAFVLGISSGARAQTRITLLSPDPLKKEVDMIVHSFEMKTGYKVQQSYGTGVSTRRTVAEGGALDVTLLFAPFDEALKTGDVDKSTQTVVARVRLALAVKEGSPAPDISNAAAVKKALLNAKSIATVDPNQGSVGGAAMLAFDKMGITDQVKSKVKLFPGGGGVQQSVANGETEVAVGPYLSDYPNPRPGLNVAGALPPDAATPVDITAWISTNAPDRKAAMALLDYFKSKEAAAIWEEARVFPVTK